LVFAIASFAGLRMLLSQQDHRALAPYQNVISALSEQAHITIYLP
jgi:type VI secretion system protein ImpK